MHKERSGISSAIFAVVAIVLAIIAASGFGLYATKPQAVSTITQTVTSTQEMTHTMTETMTESMSHTATDNLTHTATSTGAMAQEAIEFTPKQGQMIGNAWLLIEPAGMHGQYAVAIYATGLETTTGTHDVYIVEAAQASGSMATVPLTGNETSSEFGAGSDGVGHFFVLLNQSPYATFENVQIFYVRGMQMSNAALVANASLGMSHG